MPQPLDGKAYGVLFTTKDNQPIPPDEFIVFRVHDPALVPTLDFYFDECGRQHCAIEQMNALGKLINKVKDWQKAHPERIKPADVAPGELAW